MYTVRTVDSAGKVKYVILYVINIKNMKHLLIIIFIILFLFSCRNPKLAGKGVIGMDSRNLASIDSQNPCDLMKDTLEYKKCVISNKEKYLNKELGVLLQDLKAPLKSYALSVGPLRSSTPGITLSFDDRETTFDKRGGTHEQNTPLEITITWKTPIAYSSLPNVKTANVWGKAEENFYSKQIVANIQ